MSNHKPVVDLLQSFLSIRRSIKTIFYLVAIIIMDIVLLLSVILGNI